MGSCIRAVAISTERTCTTWVSTLTLSCIRLLLIWVIKHLSRLITRSSLSWIMIHYRSTIWSMGRMTWWRLWHRLTSSWHWWGRSRLTSPVFPSIWVNSFLRCWPSSLFIWWSLLIVKSIWICAAIPIFKDFIAFSWLRFSALNILLSLLPLC